LTQSLFASEYSSIALGPRPVDNEKLSDDRASVPLRLKEAISFGREIYLFIEGLKLFKISLDRFDL
jgi:hypothetical protein